MAEPLNHLKNDYRARFCYGEGKEQINVQPGQNALKIIQDCFESCVSDSTINSPSITYCSTPVILKQKKDLLLSKELNSGLFNSVRKTFNSTSSVVASPVKSVSSSAGQSTEAHQTPIILDDIVNSNKNEGRVLKEDKNSGEDDFVDAGDPVGTNEKTNSILKDVERSSPIPAGIFDADEDNYEIIGSPVLLVEEAETFVHLLSLDEKATSAIMERQTEVQRSEGPEVTTQEKIVPEKRTKCCSVPSEQKKKSLSSAFLVAVTTGTDDKRHSSLIPPASPSPVKDLDLGMEDECEFLIDESDGFSFTSWFSIPKKNKKVEKQAVAKPVPKPQPSERKKAVVRESKKRKDRRAQNEVAVKQTRMEQSKMDPSNVAEGIQDELQNSLDVNLVLSEKKENVLKSVRQSGPHIEESKKHTHGQRSTRTPNEKKSPVLKQIQPKKFTFLISESDTETSDTEQHKPTEIPNEDSFGSCNTTEQPQEKIASSKQDHNSPKPPHSILKTALFSSHKKQTAKQKLSKVASSKKLVENQRNKVRKSALKSTSRKTRVQISEESSDSDPIEEVNERELLKSNKLFGLSLQQESQTPILHKSHQSFKLKNVIHSLESSGNVYIKTPAKAKEPLQNLINNPEDAGERKKASTKSLRQTATHINQRTDMIDCSHPENAELGNTTVHKDSSDQNMAEQKDKKSNASVKTKYKKKSNACRSQVSPVPESNKSHSSGPVLNRYVKFTSKNSEPIACEWEDSSSDKSMVLKDQASEFLPNSLGHKLVMPSHTPNVRRTKRIRLKPLDYWRGERVNYLSRPSGGFVVGGITYPKKESRREARKKRKHTPKTRSHVEHLNVSLADASKPTVVWDPTVNEEVLLECVNTGRSHSCFFNDESVEIYKNLNTSGFAAGKLILKPLKEKGHQFVHTDKIAFHVIRGKIIVTLHKTSYYLTTGDFFYVPEGNGYNIRNLLNEESILLFTQLKGERECAVILNKPKIIELLDWFSVSSEHPMHLDIYEACRMNVRPIIEDSVNESSSSSA